MLRDRAAVARAVLFDARSVSRKVRPAGRIDRRKHDEDIAERMAGGVRREIVPAAPAASASAACDRSAKSAALKGKRGDPPR